MSSVAADNGISGGVAIAKRIPSVVITTSITIVFSLFRSNSFLGHEPFHELMVVVADRRLLLLMMPSAYGLGSALLATVIGEAKASETGCCGGKRRAGRQAN